MRVCTMTLQNVALDQKLPLFLNGMSEKKEIAHIPGLIAPIDLYLLFLFRRRRFRLATSSSFTCFRYGVQRNTLTTSCRLFSCAPYNAIINICCPSLSLFQILALSASFYQHHQNAIQGGVQRSHPPL